MNKKEHLVISDKVADIFRILSAERVVKMQKLFKETKLTYRAVYKLIHRLQNAGLIKLFKVKYDKRDNYIYVPKPSAEFFINLVNLYNAKITSSNEEIPVVYEHKGVVVFEDIKFNVR